jgi:hypothetical protein
MIGKVSKVPDIEIVLKSAKEKCQVIFTVIPIRLKADFSAKTGTGNTFFSSAYGPFSRKKPLVRPQNKS